jgi:hypothetical protein
MISAMTARYYRQKIQGGSSKILVNEDDEFVESLI